MALSVNAMNQIGNIYDLARDAQAFVQAVNELDIWWTGDGDLTSSVVVDQEARNQMPSLTEIEKADLDDVVYGLKLARDAVVANNYNKIRLLAGVNR